MRVCAFLQQHNWHNDVAVHSGCQSLLYLLDQCCDGFDAAIGRGFVGYFDASIGTADAPQINAPLQLPWSTQVGQSLDGGQRLGCGNHALAELLAVEANVTLLKRHHVDSPTTAVLGDGASAPETPSAIACAFEEHQWQP